MNEIFFFLLHFCVCAILINGTLLCLQRKVDKRPRIYLAIFSFIAAAEIGYRIFTIYRTGVVTNIGEVLPIYVLVSGILEILLIYLYPLEIVKPRWLNSKRAFVLFLPWLIIGSICVFIYPDFRYLSSFSEMVKYSGEFNVWFRLVILFLCFIPYTILLLFIPRKWQQSSVDKKWIYRYVAGIQILGLLFSASVITGSVMIICIHFLYGSLFFLYVTYQELYLRLIPTSETSQVAKTVFNEGLPEKRELATEENPLWNNLMIQMNEKELWRNPDLTLDDLARNLCTNRTTLSTLIHQQGYSGYADFINRRRIEAFVEVINRVGSCSNTLQLFYDVGFRSKSTALRNFRLYMKCTPSEYIEYISKHQQRSDKSTFDSFNK